MSRELSPRISPAGCPRAAQLLLLTLLLLPACRGDTGLATEAAGKPPGPSPVTIETGPTPATAIPAVATPTFGLAEVTSSALTPTSPVLTPLTGAANFSLGVAQIGGTVEELRSPDYLREQMQAVRELGITTILQAFPPELTPEDWTLILDIAAEEGLSIAGKPGPVDWNPAPDDLSRITELLAVIGDHPALYSLMYLHEPWELYTTAEIQQMYREIKEQFPDVRLGIALSGGLDRSTQPDRSFADDMCDLCLVNLKPFQADPAMAAFQGADRLVQAFAVIPKEDPDAEIWSSAQVWAPVGGGRREFQVATPDEMTALFCAIIQQYPVRGFFWEVWTFDKDTVGTLREPDGAEMRQAVRDSYEQCVLDS